MIEETYCGYTNYPTWNVMLWLENDPDLNYEAGTHILSAEKKTELADRIKDMMEEKKPDLGTNTFSDILSWAIEQVNWDEIAKYLWEVK